jgi:transcriptional regulator with XRE-family HTH domain
VKKQPTLAERIKSLRESAGLSQSELAGSAGVTKSAVGMIETGKRPYPQADTLARIARALGTTSEKLLGM